jgi:hypothetical protein
MSTFQSLDGERLYFTDETEQRRLCFEPGDAELFPDTVQIRVVAEPESFFRLKEITYRLTLDEAKKARDYLARVVALLEARAAGTPRVPD